MPNSITSKQTAANTHGWDFPLPLARWLALPLSRYGTCPAREEGTWDASKDGFDRQARGDMPSSQPIRCYEALTDICALSRMELWSVSGPALLGAREGARSTSGFIPRLQELPVSYFNGHEPPIQIPTRNTKTPPAITWNTARRNGVGIPLSDPTNDQEFDGHDHNRNGGSGSKFWNQ